MTNRVSYRIGGKVWLLSGMPLVRRVRTLEGWEPFRLPCNGSYTFGLHHEKDEPDYGQWRLTHGFPLTDVVECRYGEDGFGNPVVRFSNGLAFSTSGNDPRRMELYGYADDPTLRFALWMACGYASLPRLMVPMHASAVVYGDRAVLCLGESGTGKSTHTRLWTEQFEGAYLLNDDSPMVGVEGAHVYAYGSPWSGKTPCYRQERVRVAALVRIVQSPGNRMTQLDGLRAFAAVQPSCPPAMMHSERQLDLLVRYLDQLLRRVPVYRLECRPDADAAHLCRYTLFPPRRCR